MKKLVLIAIIFLNAGVLAAQEKKPMNQKADSIEIPLHANAELLARFPGQQVTGVTITNQKQLFVNFPRWREGLKNSVLKISPTRGNIPYPDKKWNSWKIGDQPSSTQFIGVQSVVAQKNSLYVLDTRSVEFQPPLDAPRIFVFDLESGLPTETYILSKNVYYPDSYINDLRIDRKNNRIYMTDSGHAGLIVLNMRSGKCKRVLDNHYSTRAETDHLTFDDQQWKGTINSDGIALDQKAGILYYHALSGYTLYAIKTKDLIKLPEKELETKVQRIAHTGATDGMFFDQRRGNLIISDLEHHEIRYFKPGKEKKTHLLISGEYVKWSDTFSGDKYDLYYTNSRINEVKGDISKLAFTVYKVGLPGK